MKKKCGYSFWGYLGDIKFNRNGEEASTPDGNAFYSWCIIRELQRRGYDVTMIMPDRDKEGFDYMGVDLFSSWADRQRKIAYILSHPIDWWDIIGESRFRVDPMDPTHSLLRKKVIERLDSVCSDMEFILHEYRMLIPGRNDDRSMLLYEWQPDYFIQRCLFEYCCEKHKKLILFDLDYKIDFALYHSLRENGCPVTIFELGTKWQRYKEMMPSSMNISARQVYIPFDFDYINEFEPLPINERENDLIYVGNRYERDWCIDKYIPVDLDNCIICGNWLEGGRDTLKRWPKLKFGKRLQTKDMRMAYGKSVATILLAKREYCDFGFMTARILESVFYGTVPLFIEEYGGEVIKKYAGVYADYLTVKDMYDVTSIIQSLKEMEVSPFRENDIIMGLREHLRFMDVKNFVDAIEEVL